MIEKVLLYLPVLHAGYLEFLQKYAHAERILLLGTSFDGLYPVMKKDIRALAPEHAAIALRALCRAPVVVVEIGTIQEHVQAPRLVVPDEAISHQVVAAYGLDVGRPVEYVPTFLRWDRKRILEQRPIQADATVSRRQNNRDWLQLARQVADSSSDWWRQVGAVIVQDGRHLVADHNRHLPTEYAPYLNGDPRGSFHRGDHIELSTAIHAEAAVIGQAARNGWALQGAELYVTDFPCPPCAYLIAEAGFARLYYGTPYAMLDGDAILRQAGVELVWVDLSDD